MQLNENEGRGFQDQILELPDEILDIGHILVITVYGHPAPQGSKRHVGHGRLIEQSKRVKPWRDRVEAACLDVAGGLPGPLCGPIYAELVFTVPRPKTKSCKGYMAPITRASGDIDKIIRSTFDAIVDARVIADDSHVTCVSACKVYPGDHPDALDEPGCVIRLRIFGESA